MSPLSLRRYRAERLLRQEFLTLRAGVLASVRARLRASTPGLAEADLEACYVQAWHGLYAAVLEGQQIANPAGWLSLVTFRRALDEQRRQGTSLLSDGAPGSLGETSGGADDLAVELDRRVRVRHLFEALRLRLGARERQAAALCYLQGFSRAEAAAQLGVSEARMRKLMEGRDGRPGVAAKISALAVSINEGRWCQEQGSLMRGLAFGVLDPDGPRYQLALSHSAACPACRAYVRSLRGLAALLPPPLLPGLHAALHGGSLPAAGEGLCTGAAQAVKSAGAGACRGSSAGQLGGVPASASAGAGAAGGGWLVAGGPAAKLAVGCVLAIGVGAGCVSLGGHRPPSSARHGRAHASRPPAARAARLDSGAAAPGASSPTVPARTRPGVASAPVAAPSAALSPVRRAGREFGPEQALASSGSPAHRAPAASTPVARAAAVEAGAAGPTRAAASAAQPRASAPGSASAAQREFSPG